MPKWGYFQLKVTSVLKDFTTVGKNSDQSFLNIVILTGWIFIHEEPTLLDGFMTDAVNYKLYYGGRLIFFETPMQLKMC